MATTYPTTKQSVPNPTGTDLLDNSNAQLDHDYQHSTVNDTIEALQDKVGIDNDPNVDSFDYKLSDIASGEKAISSNGSGQTLVDITLTDPQINFGGDATGDMYYRSAGGVTTRLPIGTAGDILQVDGTLIPEWVANPAASDASTTVKGVVEEATLAETLARTGTGGTGARTFVSPVNLTTVQTYDYAASTTGNDTYAITVTPAPTAYITGQVFRFKVDTANTGSATINVNSLGAKSIVKDVNTALGTGDILADQIIEVIYDGTNMVMKNPVANVASFGAWASATKDASTQVTQNSFLVVYGDADTNSGFSIKTDSSNPPTTVRAKWTFASATERGSACVPVRKNDYYLIEPTVGTTANVVAYIITLGT